MMIFSSIFPSILIALALLAPVLFISSMPLSASQESLNKGLVLSSTRVIYPESAKNGVSFSITNNADVTYLMQSRVALWGEEGGANDGESSPFLVLPPLQRFAPTDKMTLKIRLVHDQLPKDRESVFALLLKAIPAQDGPNSKERHSSTDGKLVIATQNQLKIFYRPASLPNDDTEAVSKKLGFIREEKTLVVNNPTPFYVTFATLSLGDKSIDSASLNIMVAPYSSQRYILPEIVSTELKWALVNQHGQVTSLQSRTLL